MGPTACSTRQDMVLAWLNASILPTLSDFVFVRGGGESLDSWVSKLLQKFPFYVYAKYTRSRYKAEKDKESCCCCSCSTTGLHHRPQWDKIVICNSEEFFVKQEIWCYFPLRQCFGTLHRSTTYPSLNTINCGFGSHVTKVSTYPLLEQT